MNYYSNETLFVVSWKLFCICLCIYDCGFASFVNYVDVQESGSSNSNDGNNALYCDGEC